MKAANFLNGDLTEGEEISFENNKREGFRIPFISPIQEKEITEREPSLLKRFSQSKKIESIYEQFFIFGVKKQELIECTETNQSNNVVLKPSVLYSYPVSIDAIRK